MDKPSASQNEIHGLNLYGLNCVPHYGVYDNSFTYMNHKEEPDYLWEVARQQTSRDYEIWEV